MATYDIRFDREGDLGVVHLGGDFGDIGQLLGEIRRRTRELLSAGLTRVLVLREPGRVAPPVALCEMLLSIADLGSDRLRCAVVYPDYGADLSFFDATAAARGLAYRAFRDRESAERYLRS